MATFACLAHQVLCVVAAEAELANSRASTETTLSNATIFPRNDIRDDPPGDGPAHWAVRRSTRLREVKRYSQEKRLVTPVADPSRSGNWTGWHRTAIAGSP